MDRVLNHNLFYNERYSNQRKMTIFNTYVCGRKTGNKHPCCFKIQIVMKKNIPGKDDKPLTKKSKEKLKMDWDQRPDFICPGCGYRKVNCMCKTQSQFTKQLN